MILLIRINVRGKGAQRRYQVKTEKITGASFLDKFRFRFDSVSLGTKASKRSKVTPHLRQKLNEIVTFLFFTSSGASERAKHTL